jgi:hypothetical protein
MCLVNLTQHGYFISMLTLMHKIDAADHFLPNFASPEQPIYTYSLLKTLFGINSTVFFPKREFLLFVLPGSQTVIFL